MTLYLVSIRGIGKRGYELRTCLSPLIDTVDPVLV